ncbi:hypothetical protein CVIRNUC_006995 [Coccomyxa viridis]|uniref:Uncharacterized protein n=1 Tax=Coccomyxa viridis TaxID=1274662 RepID=A0AAV1IBW1_9CHLO|nr:hypothetical protein CVIRNUC_006995 [Coccomyxa viridis]
MLRGALILISIMATAHSQPFVGLQSSEMPDSTMSGMGSVLSSFLNNDAAKSDLNLVAANLAGVSHSFITAPFVALSSFVNGTAVAVEQTVGDFVTGAVEYGAQAAAKTVVEQIKGADSFLHSTVQAIATALPKNNTVLKGSSMELGDESSSWDGFQLPSIDLGDGITINAATVDLNTLEQLADDVASQFCSPAFSNSSGTVPATLTYPTFTLTLETGACVLTTDFTPNPDNPYDDWLATKGFVCKTPQLSFDQEPTSYVAQYTAPATLITPSCKIAKNTTDGWTKTLYTAGDPVTYASREAFMAATMNGSATPVFTVTDKQTMMAKVAAELHSVGSSAAAEAPPLVIHVDESHNALPSKAGRRLKELIQLLE